MKKRKRKKVVKSLKSTTATTKIVENNSNMPMNENGTYLLKTCFVFHALHSCLFILFLFSFSSAYLDSRNTYSTTWWIIEICMISIDWLLSNKNPCTINFNMETVFFSCYSAVRECNWPLFLIQHCFKMFDRRNLCMEMNAIETMTIV